MAPKKYGRTPGGAQSRISVQKGNFCGAPLKEVLRDCAYVNQFYIETRYPSDSYMPVSEGEAQDCMDAAKGLVERLKE